MLAAGLNWYVYKVCLQKAQSMQNSTVFFAKVPDWLLKLEVSDELFAAAYEQLPGAQRAWLKTCLARQHAVWGDPRESRICNESFRQGFEVCLREEPVDWVLILLDENFSAAPRFLAALAPALLAGVKAVYVLRATQDFKRALGTGAMFPQAVLVAAELAGLAGQGQVFEVSPEQAQDFLQDLGEHSAKQRPQENSQGRLLMLGENFWGEELLLAAARFGITTWSRGMLPVLAEADFANQDFQRSEFQLLHPGLEIVLRKKSEAACGHSSLSAEAALCSPGFNINPGQEGVWFWPELDINFFFKRHFSISSRVCL